MNNIMFDYNHEAALTAGQGGFIGESGAYVVTITEAKYITAQSGADSLELSVETDDGRKANFLSIWCKKKDGTPNAFGVNMVHAVMGCAGVKQLTSHMKDVNTYIAPELTGKKIGLVLQKILRSKRDGSDTYGFEIKIPFIAATRQTLQEKAEAKPATAIDRIALTLKDKDERVKRHNPYEDTYPGDDKFFSPQNEQF